MMIFLNYLRYCTACLLEYNPRRALLYLKSLNYSKMFVVRIPRVGKKHDFVKNKETRSNNNIYIKTQTRSSNRFSGKKVSFY